MINMVMLHLRMVLEVGEVVLETLTFLALFQISLKTFLAKVLVGAEEDPKDLITVAQI